MINGMSDATVHLACEEGSLVLTGADPQVLLSLPGVRFDPRTQSHRAEGRSYRAIIEHLRAAGIKYQDGARGWQVTPWPLRISRDPFPHQREAVDAWWQAGGRGLVVLPTGTGKTFVAMLAIQQAGR